MWFFDPSEELIFYLFLKIIQIIFEMKNFVE